MVAFTPFLIIIRHLQKQGCYADAGSADYLVGGTLECDDGDAVFAFAVNGVAERFNPFVLF